MEIQKALSRIGSGYRRYRAAREVVINEIGDSNTGHLVAAALFATPLVLYADLGGTWSQMLAMFNDHVTPIDVKFAHYIDFLGQTDCWHVFLKVVAFMLALDALTIVVRLALWWRGSSAPSAQS